MAVRRQDAETLNGPRTPGTAAYPRPGIAGERPAAEIAEEDIGAAAPSAAARSSDPGAIAWRWVRGLRHFALLAVAVVIWQLWSTYVLTPVTRTLLPAPTTIVVAAWELMRSGDLFNHLIDSARREAVAFLWASFSIPIGVFMGWSKAFEHQFDPIVEMLRPIPPIAWIPLSILWFGIGDTQNEFIIFLGIFFPILINTIAGVKNVEKNLIRAARCLGADEIRVIWRVVVHAALPHILTGIRIGLGVGWMALVAAELVGANSGLGFLINDSRTLLRTDFIIVGMATIGLVGLSIDQIIRYLSRRFLPWSGTATQ